MLTSTSDRERPLSASSFSRNASALGDVLRVASEAVPALTDVGDAPQRRVALAAEVDRRVRLLHGLRVLAARRQVVELAVELGDRIGPQRLHHVEVLAAAVGALRERRRDRLELFREPADADAEVDTSVREPVDRGDLLRGVDGVALRDEADARPETDRARVARPGTPSP